MKTLSIFLLGYLALLSPLCISCISLHNDLDDKYTCEQFQGATNLNLTWAGTVDNWYIPLWNKVEYSHLAQLFYGDERFPHLTQEELSGMCMTYKIDPQSVVFSSPSVDGGSTVNLYPIVDPLPENVAIFYWTTDKRLDDFGLEYMSKSFTTFTDNKTFLITINQWYDGHKGFTVSSPTPTLDEETIKTVEAYLVSIGFNAKNFIRYDYSKCQ